MMAPSCDQMSLPNLGPTPDPQHTTSTFVRNMSVPIHRWFRYSAGFSALWARELLQQEWGSGRRRVLDPFVGSGTVLLEAELCGAESVGLEAHPFVFRVARTKLCWREDPDQFREYALAVLKRAKGLDGTTTAYAPLMHKCFPPQVLSSLDTLRRAWEERADGSPLSQLTWLALVSILRECSPAGTAQWQYVLPKKTKASAAEPYTAFRWKVHMMADDMARRQLLPAGPAATLHQDDARNCASVPDGWAHLVVTSPPYTNNYDYADATRLEMTFLGEVSRWADLHDAVRARLLPSCTQHVSRISHATYDILQDRALDPIRREIAPICRRLDTERQKHGGRKTYHTMIAAYFADMAKAWTALRRATARGALICYVVGDSAPYGIHVPVDKWLGELAVAAGFGSYSFEKTRDRNVKWKNRKHGVPLHEGRLWVRG